MSRIWKMPIELSDKVNIEVKENNVKVKWPLWELSFNFSKTLEIKVEDNVMTVIPLNGESTPIWWTTRSVLNNMVIWVTEWFKKSLEINGVWYKFEVQGNKLILSIGYSHKVEMVFPEGLKVEMDAKLKNVIHVSGIDKQLVWEFAAKVKAKKKPEPYKWKWIKYVWEYIRRKAWKTWSK